MKTIFGSLFVLSIALTSCNKDKTTLDDVTNVMVKDSLETYKKLYNEAAYFSIDKNENAQKSFAPQNIEDVMAKVVQDFSTLNQQEGGNPLLPKDNKGEASKLNRMSVINHKWLIVDFYNESSVGELLIRYDYAPDKTTEFTVIDRVVY
ncbi:MAG TPA: hypothetical protein VLY87_01200 [Flavobacterium sp.]|nr:hypothetical protein [Flavobacterium sp.]